MDSSKNQHRRIRKVVLTGGPAAGKTAISDVLNRQLDGRICVVPESATILFKGGFPRPVVAAGREIVQRAVFSLQRELEEVFEVTHAHCPHVLDRASLDGSVYWPGGVDSFLEAMGTTREDEYARYDAVIFLASSAYGDGKYSDENPVRCETPAEARELDTALREVWAGHPRFNFVDHQSRFYEKVAAVLITLEQVLRIDSGVSPDA